MLGEFAPLLVPQFDALLVSLLVIAGAIVALGIVTIVHKFSTGVAGVVAGALGVVPVLGELLASPVNSVVHWLDHEFSQAEQWLDLAIARYLHSLGELVAWVGREIRQHAHLLSLLATVMVGPAAVAFIYRHLSDLRGLVTGARHLGALAIARLQALERSIAHAGSGLIGAALHKLLAPLTAELRWFEHLTLPRLRGLEREIGGTIAHELDGLRGWADTLTREYEALWNRVKQLERAIPAEAATIAVATALAELGGSWIRCRNWGKIGRGVCSMPLNLIEGLLAGAIDALLITDLCAITGALIEGAQFAAPLIDELVGGIEELMQCQGSSRPPALKVRRVALPPVRVAVAL